MHVGGKTISIGTGIPNGAPTQIIKGAMEWIEDEYYHRVNGPARILEKGETWYIHGVCHRMFGPVHIFLVEDIGLLMGHISLTKRSIGSLRLASILIGRNGVTLSAVCS